MPPFDCPARNPCLPNHANFIPSRLCLLNDQMTSLLRFGTGVKGLTRRFGSEIIYHARNSLHLIRNPQAHPFDEIFGWIEKVGSHEVCGLYCSKGYLRTVSIVCSKKRKP